MADKILKEAFDKLSAIEEDDRNQMHVNQVADIIEAAREELFDSPRREEYEAGVNDMYNILTRRLGL